MPGNVENLIVIYRLFLISIFFTVSAGAACTTSSVLELRGKPDPKAKVVKAVGKYTPVVLTGKKQKKFIEIKDQFGKHYWVRGGRFSQELNCVSVKPDKSLLRTGPGSDYESYPNPARQGEGFIALGGEDGWAQVEDEKGNRYWIDMDHLWRPDSAKTRISIDFDE